MVTRKQYTKEYKLDAISLVLDQSHTTTEVSRSLEINAIMLRRWIRENQADDADQAFWGNGKLTSEQEEIQQLKVQLRQLKVERQIKHPAASNGVLPERSLICWFSTSLRPKGRGIDPVEIKGSDGLFRARNEVKHSFITQRKKCYGQIKNVVVQT